MFTVKIYHKKFQSACNRADQIIAISQQTKNDIIEFFGTDGNKIKVEEDEIQTEVQKQKINQLFKFFKSSTVMNKSNTVGFEDCMKRVST